MKLVILALSIFFTLFSNNSKAEISTQTLPAGVRSPSLRYGFISQLDQKYTDSGSLAKTIDLRSIEFDAKRLSQLVPRVKDLVELFNDMGRYNLGNDLNLGTLRIDSKPDIQYTGLVFGYGITDRWTLGGGIPVLHYRNRISISTTANNIEAIHDQVRGANPDLDRGLDEMAATDLIQSFNSELQRKGYNPLEDQDSTFLGDLQLVSMYRLTDNSLFSSLFRFNLNLPTGPKFNTDNLAALNQFGFTYFEPQLLASYPLGSRLSISGLGGVRIYLPDQVAVRVPTDQDDLLPDSSQREVVSRQGGTKFSEAVQLGFRLDDSWSLFGISEWSQKQKDRYAGGQGRRYDLLSEGTDSETQVLTAGISYSSVESYRRRQKGLPAIIGLQVSDTISGRNTERQLVQELSAILFF